MKHNLEMMPVYNEQYDRNYRSEMRIKRNHERRVAQTKRQMTALILIVSIVLFISLFLRVQLQSDAHGEDRNFSYKYYETITVTQGDSLWSIAQAHMDDDHYSSVNAYINEVRSINNMDRDASEITAGTKLVIPYYSTEFVQ